ncbi:MAG: hypothetical protein ACXWPM_03210 [Bdellovibrionota bacterium]
MKRALAIVAALSVGLSAAGCSKNNSAGGHIPVDLHPAVATGPTWTVSYESNCDGLSDGCAGASGITFSADGQYQLVDGSRKGKLLSEDLKRLTGAVETALSSTAGSETCSEAPSESDKTQIRVTHKDQGVKTLLHTSSGQYCHALSDVESAKSLQKAIAHLAGRYYFQSACVDTELALSDAYDAARTCSADADCAYVGADFSPVPLTSGLSVEAENCGYVATLSAANSQTLAASQGSIQAAASAAWAACGGDFVRYPCQPMGFTVEPSKPAVCQDHVCKVNPALGF